MVADAAHVVYLARGQAQKLDRVVSEASDRLRGQLVAADRILTGALETGGKKPALSSSAESGSQWQRVSAVVTGIKVGLDFLRSRRARGPRASDDAVEHEEELFI